jgi:hypothetical protein
MERITRIIAQMLIDEYQEVHTPCGEDFKGADCYPCHDYDKCQHNQKMKNNTDKLWFMLFDEKE